MTTLSFRNAEQRYANLEQTLNFWGYIPVASTASGVVRGFLGLVQTTLSNIAFIFKGCQYFLTRDPEHRNEAAAYFWYSVHGEMNGVRGGIETVPVVGNAATLAYDKLIGLRANYTHETLPSGTDPLFESATAKKN